MNLRNTRFIEAARTDALAKANNLTRESSIKTCGDKIPTTNSIYLLPNPAKPLSIVLEYVLYTSVSYHQYDICIHTLFC